MKYFLFILIAYFIGAIPSGVWLGKIFKNKDVRDYGSKNSGATNSYRVLGAKIGLLVLLADILKGFLPLFLGMFFIDNFNFFVLMGLISILAHTYSCFIGFRGGKGVATTVGVLLFLSPTVLWSLILIFMAVFLISKYVSLASITSAISFPILVMIFGKNSRLFGEGNNLFFILFSLAIACFIVYRHKENIKRLLKNKENKFKF